MQKSKSILKKKKKPFTLDYHIKNLKVGIDQKTRISNIKWISPNEQTNWLYHKILNQVYKLNQENFHLNLEFIQNLQFSEYTENQHGFYAKHIDSENKNELNIRKLSFSIQLSNENDYEGGELIFYIDEKKKIAPKTKGTIIVFNSNILHEIKPIKKGIRHSLVGWVLGPNLILQNKKISYE